MGITNIDPINEDIALSRFMHKTRQDIPDIDIDFDILIRFQEVIAGSRKSLYCHWKPNFHN